MKLKWSLLSRNDLREIYLYIAQDNPRAGRKVIERIRERARDLRDLPLLGRAGRVADTRELVIAEYPYIVVYAADEHGVTVLRVWPAKRRWPKKF